MKVTPTIFEGVVVLEPMAYHDDRGFFLETYRESAAAAWGLPLSFVQHNQSRSRRGVLRGLHLQQARPQGKLVRCVQGTIWDVVVDIQQASPTFGRWFGVELSDATHRQLYVPPGYAHGFQVLSDIADVVYLCTDYYQPEDEGGVRWNDPQLDITWPDRSPLLSAKDQALPLLCELAR